MTDTRPEVTLEEQIAWLQPYSTSLDETVRMAAAITASLLELQRIRKAERPEFKSFCDPECEGRCTKCPDDLLRDALAYADRMAAEREAAVNESYADARRLSDAVAELTAAEAKLARVKKGLRELAPYAWVIRGDDEADANGFIPCQVAEGGEFHKPLCDKSAIDELLRQVEGISDGC